MGLALLPFLGLWVVMMAAMMLPSVAPDQLTPWKDWCLRRCRSPIGALMYYLGFKGRSRDLRVGLHHGGTCAGCCWGLMIVLVAVGVMNVAVMAALAVVILAEKLWRHGKRFDQAVGAIDALSDCVQACNADNAADLGEPNLSEMVTCIRLCLDCADICAATAGVISRQADYDANVTRPLLEACVAICKRCGDECERHAHMPHCRVCAEACRRCEQACRDLLDATK
jgi:Predicted metal-binding integral membrane protein (DUF2182)/Domain of Unknown Function (DUF326)